jgi:hypothetical protein
MYVYRESERSLWTVGFYDPKGKWYAECDCDSSAEAAERTAWLNGSGKSPVTGQDAEQAYQAYANSPVNVKEMVAGGPFRHAWFDGYKTGRLAKVRG